MDKDFFNTYVKTENAPKYLDTEPPAVDKDATLTQTLTYHNEMRQSIWLKKQHQSSRER